MSNLRIDWFHTHELVDDKFDLVYYILNSASYVYNLEDYVSGSRSDVSDSRRTSNSAGDIAYSMYDISDTGDIFNSTTNTSNSKCDPFSPVINFTHNWFIYISMNYAMFCKLFIYVYEIWILLLL